MCVYTKCKALKTVVRKFASLVFPPERAWRGGGARGRRLLARPQDAGGRRVMRGEQRGEEGALLRRLVLSVPAAPLLAGRGCGHVGSGAAGGRGAGGLALGQGVGLPPQVGLDQLQAVLELR